MEWSISEFFRKAAFAGIIIFCLLNIFAFPLWCAMSWSYLICLKKAFMAWIAIIGFVFFVFLSAALWDVISE